MSPQTQILQTDLPPTTNIFVDFYDKDEQQSFRNSALSDSLAHLPGTVGIQTTDLLAYYLFYKKNPLLPGFSTFDDLAKKWFLALGEFAGQMHFTESSVRIIPDAILHSGTTERIGEAIGLSVASNLHGLHQADWDRIPASNTTKTLDFSLPPCATDGSHFIQVETKGSSCDDNSKKSSSVSHHRSSITDKKNAVKNPGNQDVFYGTIAVLDHHPTNPARCWLVDPPAQNFGNPKRYKILTRLKYIGALISLISPRSLLAASPADSTIRT